MAVKVLDQDTFTRANQSGFGTASGGSTWATNVGTPTLSIASNEGHATNISAQAAMQLGSVTSANQEGLVRCKTSATTSTRMGVALRFTASNTFYHARLSANANNLVIGKVVTGTNTDLFTTAFTTSIATFYWLRFKVIGTNLYARAWADGSGEPSTWTLTGTDSSITGAGGFGLTINATSTAVTWDFDSFTVNDGTVLYDTTYRGNISATATKNTTFRGVLSNIANKNTTWRGNIGHTAIKNTTYRAVLSALANKNTTYRGVLSQLASKNTAFRGNIGHTGLHDTIYRGVLSKLVGRDTSWRAKVGHAATIDTVWRANLSAPVNAVFYASNVTQSIGGLTLSSQFSRVAGGTETSVTVTMPASGTNTYVELLAQGGTSTATSALPAPTGKGWSIPLQGNTILSGSWSFAFTLAKSGIAMTGASLYVRAYRRTMDGTCYYISSSILTGQTFSTKAVYTLPSATAALWQFIAGDTLYMDCFVLNPTTAWASDVFTVYVSNSATQGVYNDGIIIAPQMVTTPAGISCLIGASSFQTGTTLPVRDQSFTLADAIDQRSILTLTGEDTAGTLSYIPAMPVMLSDHDQGLLYTGYLNSDKATKPAAGTSNAQLEHMMTMADHHRDYDKEANYTNYLNWTAGDIACDFIQQTQYKNGITGAFALESDYSQAAFAQGTLTGTVATTTTSPFTYAPNTASPPATSNTGDLELTRAGVQFTLTEDLTADFATGTLTNMVASNNQLSPATQSAVKVTALYSPVATASNSPAQESGGTQSSAENFVNLAYVQIWSGSMTVGVSDTFNYDLWIASTSPAFLAGVDIEFSDNSFLSDHNGTLDSNNNVGLFDQNSVSVDDLQDLSVYAKDVWYTRNIALTGLNGKIINGVYVYLAGSSSGTYTVFAKNCYLTSQSGSPFFGTAATATQLNPPTIQAAHGGYLPTTINTSVVSAYNPVTSYRVSPAHSISGVGLVQNSNITWTASLPTSGAIPTAYPPGTTGAASSTSGAGSMVMMVSYDGNAWLECLNSQALPGLPSGANVSGLSLYLREQFAAASDPTAIPALLDVQITINSAANQTVSDVAITYGTSTQWNTGTQVLTNPNANGNLTIGGSANPLTRDWNNNLITNQTFLAGAANSGTQAATGGAYTMTPGAQPTGGSWCQSRFDLAGYFQNGVIEADVKVSTTGFYTECGIEYRQTGWGNANNNGAYYAYIGQGGVVGFGYGSNNFGNTAGTFTTILATGATITANTYYHLKIVVQGNRHTIYFNHNSTPIIDVIDNAYTSAGQIGFRAWTNSTSSFTASIDNLSVVTTTAGTWTSPSTSLNALGTCGYSQVCWTDLDSRGQVEQTTTVLASIDGGTTWQQCTNGAEVPQLPRGTSVSGVSIQFQAILFSATPPISTPVLMGLHARICGNYGTVTGTRISPALPLTSVGYVANSNVMWNANVPTSTSLTVQTTQDLSTFHTVGSSGAGEALTYWTNQPSATQDLFNSNTLANYTNTNKVGGSAASVAYNITSSSITLAGGSSALYLDNAVSCADVDLFVDMDMSDAGGLTWQELDLNTGDFYEVAVHDASSSSGFTNQLRLYKTSGGTRSLLGSASSIVFTRGTVHRIRVTMQGGLINVYWDGNCVQSYLDLFPLGAGKCGLRNDGGTSRYYQLWVQPLGTNLTGQKLQTKVTMTTTDPSVMPQLFTLVACIRGPSIGTGATVSQLHPVTKPFAAYYSNEMDSLVQQSGDYYWYVDRWKQLRFGPRLARPGAFPVQSTTDQDPANPVNVHSGYLLYQPQVSVLSSADLFRSQQIVTNVSGLVTPPPETKVTDGSTTSWAMGYPLYSVPAITINGQGASVGLQGIDNNHQFYWQPGSASISYDSTLPKLPAGTVLVFSYVGESTVNTVLNNSASQTAQAALELNSGIVAEIESALNSTARGMSTDQATTFGNGLLSRYGSNSTIEMIGTTRYGGLTPGTTIGLFLQEVMGTWNAQLPVVKVTTTVFQGQSGLIWLYSVDATNGANLSQWQRVFYAQ